MKLFGLTIGAGDDVRPLVLGAQPAVDLLPPEVRVARKSRGVRRGVVALAVLLVVGVAAGGAWARLQSVAADDALAAERARTASLLERQAEFGGVMAVQAEIDERIAARQVITSTEVDWQAVMAAVTAALPDDTSFVSFTVEGGSPMEAYGQPTVPLQGTRIATLSFTVQSPALLAVPEIEEQLSNVPGFVDVQVPSAMADPEGIFETSFVVHLNDAAFAGRFPPDPATAEQPAGTDDATADADAEGAGSR